MSGGATNASERTKRMDGTVVSYLNELAYQVTCERPTPRRLKWTRRSDEPAGIDFSMSDRLADSIRLSESEAGWARD